MEGGLVHVHLRNYAGLKTDILSTLPTYLLMDFYYSLHFFGGGGGGGDSVYFMQCMLIPYPFF